MPIESLQSDVQPIGADAERGDIATNFEAVQALRESEQRFRQLFEIAADYYWETDAQYRVNYLSPNFEAVAGVPPTLGKRLIESPGVRIDPEMGKKGVLAQKQRKPYRDLVYSRKLPSGEIRWFSLSAAPIFGEDGEFRGYRGVGTNITERTREEAAARLAQRRLHDAVAYVTQPFVVFDAEDRAVAFNQAFVELHTIAVSNTPVHAGVAFGDLVEWQLRVGFYASDPDQEPVGLEMLLARHQTEDEHAYHLRDGRWMVVTYRRLPGGGRVGLWTDITAIKRADEQQRRLEAQEQMYHAQRLEALGTLAGGIAHELNNTLVPVLGLTKLMMKRHSENSREQANLATILQAGERARDLVSRILAFSRKEATISKHVDLASLVRDSLKLIRASLPVTIDIAEALETVPPVLGDPNQLHQILLNLVVNAAQSIGRGMGTITIALRATPFALPVDDGVGPPVRCVGLTVSDSGCGMDEATMQRVFEPFFTTKPVGEGTGLGLSMVHSIVAQHGGKVTVESRVGQGTRFDVYLPVLGHTDPRQSVETADAAE